MEHSIVNNTLNKLIDEIIKKQEKKRTLSDAYDGYWELPCPGKGCNEMIPYYRQGCGKYYCLKESVNT